MGLVWGLLLPLTVTGFRRSFRRKVWLHNVSRAQAIKTQFLLLKEVGVHGVRFHVHQQYMDSKEGRCVCVCVCVCVCCKGDEGDAYGMGPAQSSKPEP